MLDISVPFFDVIMCRKAGQVVARPPLPEGFRFTRYQAGDEVDWAKIEASVLEFDSEEQARRYYRSEWLPYGSELDRRCLFVESPDGEKVATTTVWWEYNGNRRDVWIHWVAVKPMFQGLGLGKAIVGEALALALEIEGDRDIYLHTQTWSHKAIGIYEKAGFHITDEPGWHDPPISHSREAIAVLEKIKAEQSTTGSAEIRRRIIDLITNAFREDSRVFAAWLEGSDGLGTADKYSDLDFWLDVEDGLENQVLDQCEEILRGVSGFDFYQKCQHPHPKIFQRNFRLSGFSEYLFIDLCVQSHSRGREGCTFVEGDIAEFPLVLFDKANVVAIIPEPPPDEAELAKLFEEASLLWNQRARVTKYMRRGLFLESLIYYRRYVAEQLVLLARLLYTPRHWDYGFIHASSHFPEELVKEFEALNKINGIGGIARALPRADRLYETLTCQLREKYSFLRDNH